MDTALGVRIRALREQAGLLSRDLADQIGLDPTAMSKIEAGKRSVKTMELGAIAEALKVSPLALLDEGSLLANLPIAARSAGQSITEGNAYQRLVALTELHSVLNEAGIGTATERPKLKSAGGWKKTAESWGAWAASHLDLQIGADDRFGALTDAIETRLGVDVLVESYPGDPLSGASITDWEFPLLFVNSSYSTSRCLFTLAHELGHLLAGHQHSITLDRELSGSDESERMANAFAASLLTPEADVRSYLDRYGRGAEALLRMIHDFGVSYESLVYRLYNLRIVDNQGKNRLRSLGWAQLLAALDDPELAGRLGPEITSRLVGRVSSRPERRRPVGLTRRCFHGYRTGVVSVRPLAGLLDVDAEELLDQLSQVDDEPRAAFDEQFPLSTDPRETDEALYSVSPV